MSALIITYPLREAILAALTGAGFPLDAAGLTAKLLKAPFDANTRTTRAACLAAEPTNVEMPGYAGKAFTAWNAAFRDGADNVYQDAGLKQWVLSADAPAPLSIYGVWWDDGADVIIQPFDAPITVTLADDRIPYIPLFGYGQ